MRRSHRRFALQHYQPLTVQRSGASYTRLNQSLTADIDIGNSSSSSSCISSISGIRQSHSPLAAWYSSAHHAERSLSLTSKNDAQPRYGAPLLGGKSRDPVVGYFWLLVYRVSGLRYFPQSVGSDDMVRRQMGSAP